MAAMAAKGGKPSTASPRVLKQGGRHPMIDGERTRTMYRAKPSDDEETLYLSPQSRELLRQVLRVEKLEGETELVGAVKEALLLQYSRGFHEAMAEKTKGSDLPTVPPPGERKKLTESPYEGTSSSAARRRNRRARRLRRRLRNGLVTIIILVLAGAGVLALNATRPPLSANNPNARHRIDWYRSE
jgi:hypothetical protein